MNDMQEEINQYYERKHITPVGYKEKETLKEMYSEMFSDFNCCKKDSCWDACHEAHKASNQAEDFLFAPHTDGTYVSQYYQDRNYEGDRIPRIVVVSLSAPKPYDPFAQNESQSYSEKLNPHWLGTLVTVRSLLHAFELKNFPKTVYKQEDKKIIEKIFVHVRTAKCCSNAGGRSQEPGQVYANCGPYFCEELRILEPDVIVTQGKYAHRAAKKHVFAKKAAVEKIEDIDYSIAHIVNLKQDNRSIYWLRSHFPYGRFYSHHHAGPKIKDETNLKGAMRENLVRYGKEIKKFMDAQGH